MAERLTRRHSVLSTLTALGLAVFGAGAALAGGPPSPGGDSYSFAHGLGRETGPGVFDCFFPHLSGMDDNIVDFDGITEFLDPYLNGPPPFIFEFETVNLEGEPSNTIEIQTMGPTDFDLFPEGFMDPKTGAPLTDACVEIGIDDLLDFDQPALVSQALLTFEQNGMPFIGPLDITSAFSVPWDGRLSIVFPSLSGLDVNGVNLQLDVEGAQDPNIFADGFESGNTASWTNTVDGT